MLIAAFAFAPLLPPPTAAAERKVEGNRVTEGVPELPERITERMRQYQAEQQRTPPHATQ